MKSISQYQSGAVSLFVVIFATLLITVVTVSFLRLMINDQNQATSSDLSQSAYDSAQAGVEDAKRALIRYQKICNEQGVSACDVAAAEIDDQACNQALANALVIPDGSADNGAGGVGEVRVQQSSSQNDTDLDQAYTCVTIQLQTDDYVGSLAANSSKLVPLVGTSTFNSVRVEWFTTQDISQTSSGSYALSLQGPSAAQPLLAQSSWPSNRPSVLRTQLMQYANSFTLSSFDTTTASSQSNANTLFLYPTSAVTASSESFVARDLRKTDPNGDTPPDQRSDTPLAVHCENNLSAGGYACSAVLNLPDPVGGSADQRRGFLRLMPFYNATHFRVTLLNGGVPVQFDSVQPEVDSTGRADDLFRRVLSRVDLIDTSFPYPEAAVDLGGNLCKDFSVTDTTYIGSATCTP